MARFISIEVEFSQVRVAEIDSGKKMSKVRNCFWFPTPRGAVEDGMIRDTKGLGEALKKELASRKIRTKKVYFVVGSTRIASREVRIPFVSKNKIQSIVNANASDYFPIDITKYVISYSVLGIENVNSGKVDNESEEQNRKNQVKQYHLMVYAAPKSISTAYHELAQTAGLNMAGLNSTGDSTYQAIRRLFSNQTCILMKIEEHTTGIMIVRNGELALQRNVNYGVDSAMDTLRAFPEFGENMDSRDALELLCNRNLLTSSLDLPMDVTEPEDTDEFIKTARREVTESLRYLVGNISRIMDYYISRNPDVNFDSIFCCGIGTQIQGLARLLTNELGQQVEPLDSIKGFSFAKERPQEGFSPYVSVLAPQKSGVNLMENLSGKNREGDMSGAIVVFAVGALAAAVLMGASTAVRLYHQRQRDELSQRIEEESAIEEIYNRYNISREQFENFQIMYEYTNTPNEGLVEFIEEMEEKMPSNITIETFSSTGTQVSFSVRLASKAEAANALMQLRTFDSLLTVTTTGIDEGEDGTVSMSVTCTYRNQALMDNNQ